MAEVDARVVKVNGSADEPEVDKEFIEFVGGAETSNGSHSESKENDANGAVLENGTNERLKWKAKRPSHAKFQLSRTNSDSQVAAPFRALKNSRKSRNGFGRGLPKKGGAGGKGTWGKLGSEALEEDIESGSMDPNDPNYDDQNLDTVRLKMTELSPSKSKEVTDEELCKSIHTIVLEYFNHGDTEEAYMSLEDLWWTDAQRPLLVVTAVEVAMDHKPSHREMTSVLMADLYNHSITEHHYAKGYDLLIMNLPDLVIDNPSAPTMLGNFIARSIADDCIPPKFLSGYKGQVESDVSARCLNRAESLLSMRHGLVRLDAVWGVGGGTRPVKHLVKKMNLLLHEYLSSDDVAEAQRCLVELEVPHFHHELVYEAVVLALEKMDDRSLSLVAKLLASLHASVIVTPNQMKEGFLRVFEDLPQITLDVPPAHSILERFVDKCKKDKTIGEEVVRKMPTRARKRFVSEGDGGRFKEDLHL